MKTAFVQRSHSNSAYESYRFIEKAFALWIILILKQNKKQISRNAKFAGLCYLLLIIIETIFFFVLNFSKKFWLLYVSLLFGLVFCVKSVRVINTHTHSYTHTYTRGAILWSTWCNINIFVTFSKTDYLCLFFILYVLSYSGCLKTQSINCLIMHINREARCELVKFLWRDLIRIL